MASYKRRTDNTLPAGDIRHRITFLRREVKVQSGISTEIWLPFITCWGMAEPLSGREYWQAATVNRETEWRFTVRFRTDIDPSMRIRYGGNDFNITSMLDPNLKHVKLELLASSVLPERTH